MLYQAAAPSRHIHSLQIHSFAGPGPRFFSLCEPAQLIYALHSHKMLFNLHPILARCGDRPLANDLSAAGSLID